MANRESVLHLMEHNGLITAGLESFLLGGGEHGKVRMFVASRATRDDITPHSHRWAFTAHVLSGVVVNTIYRPGPGAWAEQWIRSEITQVCGAEGVMNYHHTRETDPVWYDPDSQVYIAGSWYSQDRTDIHSITFSKDARVLFFEGPQESTKDNMLEPFVNGKLVPTFKTEKWMFEKLP